MSLRRQIALIIISTILIVIGIGVVSLEKRRRFIAEELEEYQELQLSYVTQAAEKVKYSFIKLVDDLYSLSQIPDVQFLEKNTCLLNMVRIQKMNRLQVDSIYRTDKNGKVRYSFPRSDCPVAGKQLMQIFEHCRLTGESLFRVVRKRNDANDFLVIAQPVYTVQGDVHLNPSNKFSGILFFISSLNQLQDYFFSSSLIRGRGYPWVITEEELLICTGNLQHHGKRFEEFLSLELKEDQQVEILSILQKMKNGERGVGEYTYNIHQDIVGDFLKLTAFTPLSLPHQTWSIAVSTPSAAVLNPLEKRIGELRFFSITLISILAAMCMLTIHLLKRNQRLQLQKLEQKEEENRKTRNQWQITFDTVDSMVFILNKSFTILRANQAVTAMGVEHPDELTGENLISILLWFAREDVDISYTEIIQRNVTYAKKITAIDSGKNYLMTIIPVKDGQEYGVDLVCYLKDITEMEDLQGQYHRAQKMESIGLMAGGVAHDLNNILSGIVSYPEILLLKLPENSDLRKPVEIIKSSGQRAAAVVDDLLTVARGVASVKSVEDVNEIIKLYLASPEFNQLKQFHPKVELLTKLSPDIMAIKCSPVHVQKCVMNLVSNGAESITGDGLVIISTGTVSVADGLKNNSKLRDGNYVVLSVSDTGNGISAKDQERIFEPFYSKKVMGKSGTGLGLAVVWNTMQDHDGVVKVQSGPQGTSFLLYFPATQDTVSRAKEQIDFEEIKGNGERVLVVDDEDLQREIAKQMLNSLGYHVSTVPSGEKAVQFLKNNSVDLLVLDMIMDPGINGCQTFEEILTFSPDQKAVIASGFSENVHVKKTLELGAKALVKKPYSFEEFGIAIKNALSDGE